MKIASLNKEITLLPYTRAMARQVNEKLMEWVVAKMNTAGSQDIDMPILNATESQELAVRLVCGLSQEEMDQITEDEYQQLTEAVQAHTSKKK
jgi:hypothetical protein